MTFYSSSHCSACYNFGMLDTLIFRALNEALDQKGGLDVNKALVLAVSGGMDSLTLAHTLRGSGLNLIVAHLDHALRAVSAQQSEALGVMMTDWGLPFISRRVDANAFAKQEKVGIEEAARTCRYRFLFEIARAHGAQAIVLAHNADDQVETVLMHFMRGSGMAGLTGMAPFSILKQFDENIPLIRPMLGISRAEIEAYTLKNHLQPLEDESNEMPVYYRNKLRLQLIPYMEELNPGFKQSVLRSAEVLRGDNALLQRLEETAFADCVSHKFAKEIVMNRKVFLELDLSLQRRVIRRALNYLCAINPDFGFEDIEKARQIIISGRGAVDLSLKTRLEMVGQDCHFLLQGAQPCILNLPQMKEESIYTLSIDETLSLNQVWQISARMLSRTEFESFSEEEKRGSNHAFLNPSLLKLPLTVRAMQSGERWLPLGLRTGRQKLSDFFVNQKIPRSARATWPLVLSGESVVWVVGLRIAHNWRLTGDEFEIFQLSLERKP